MRYAGLVSTLLFLSSLQAAVPSCPAGMPLGSIHLTVRRGNSEPEIQLDKMNRLEEGDRILYSPALRPNEKRRGEIAIVLVAAVPQSDEKENFTVLESHDASKPAEWKVPFRGSVAMYVYGPSGLSVRKLKGFLGKDQELISQLADYAEKTAQTEAVLQAIDSYDRSGGAENLGAALQGFAGQYGISSKIDRSAPLDQQTLMAIRTLNPALSAYDPIAPSGMQRVTQSAGLAATVAGLFLGSTVGLAAGSTAMALNMKTLLFPDADFRSAYAQSSTPQAVALCTSRQPNQSRKRLVYLWAMRLPDARAFKLKIEEPNHAPVRLKSVVNVSLTGAGAKSLARARDWSLTDENGKSIRVPVSAVADQPKLEVDLTSADIRPGKYRLNGRWDWDPIEAEGSIFVDDLGNFQSAKLTPESQNRLRQHSGKQVVNLTGADFQFVEKVTIVSKGDKYATAAAVPFSLPQGARRGPQNTLELQIDTTSFAAGDYTLTLQQAGGNTQSIDVKVVPEPPKIEHLPLTLNEGETECHFTLEGEGLDRITQIQSDGVNFTLSDPDPDAKRRSIRVHREKELARDSSLDLRVSLKGYAEPLLFPAALQVKAPRPVIREVNPSLPSELQIALGPRELPAGVQVGVMLQVTGAGREPSVKLACKNLTAPTVEVKAGSEKDRVKLNAMQADTLFLSLDPGIWPGGCRLGAVLRNRESGESESHELGRVIRLPKIDKLELTDEAAGEGSYAAILTGHDLELIGKAGWDAKTGQDVMGLPTPIAGEGNRQSLKIRLPWPSPTPRAPLYIWFRGEDEGRATKVRY